MLQHNPRLQIQVYTTTSTTCTSLVRNKVVHVYQRITFKIINYKELYQLAAPGVDVGVDARLDTSGSAGVDPAKDIPITTCQCQGKLEMLPHNLYLQIHSRYTCTPQQALNHW